jgi:hypothetical protein
MLQQLIHYGFHLLAPGFVAWIFFRSNWKIAWLIMLATMVVDLDHLLADPIFKSNRCSINFHPLHSYIAIGVYLIMTLFKKVRIVGIGLLLHMLADYLDCQWMA